MAAAARGSRRRPDAGATGSGRGVLEALGGDEADGDEQGDDEELLHGSDPTALDGEQIAGAGVRRRVPELRHRPGLDLADPLARQVEVLSDLLEGARLAAVEAEAQSEDCLLYTSDAADE